jgi:glutaminyl-peptide cyclotransferase
MRLQSIGALALALIFPLTACSSAPEAINSQPGQMNSPQTGNRSAGQAQQGNASSQEVPTYTFEIVNSWPHDCKAFTQGLVFYQNLFFESTGQYGESSLRRVEPETGKVLKKIKIDGDYFAEGITIFQGKIFQLTWESHKGFIYDLESFERTGEFTYEGEGWGLTHDGRSLIMSDGTNRIRFLDPVSLKVERKISVYDNNQPLMLLNELEYIKGEIYANIWRSDRIVRINPANGKITGWIDLTGLLSSKGNCQQAEVLNGVAYEEAGDRLFVTGKLWPKVFEIRLKRK